MKLYLLIALLLGGLAASAQKRAPLREPDMSKPLLFAAQPNAAPINPDRLDYLLELPVGDTLSFWLTPALRLQGVVLSHADGQDKGLKSVVIRSSNLGGAIFNLSRRQTGAVAEYNGRLLSHDHGDAFEIVCEGGKYRLEKRRLYDLLSE
jgi:hypothetical protein